MPHNLGMSFDFAGAQLRGARQTQEDAFCVIELEGALLSVVADGMGGHRGGERASALAVQGFLDQARSTAAAPKERLRRGLRGANEAIARGLREDSTLEAMGTTLLAIAVTGSTLAWISVGDSPLYLWSDGELARLNEDHSMRAILERLGKPASAKAHSVLRAALTGGEIALTDESERRLPAGAIILGASDGMHTLAEGDLVRVLAGRSDAPAAEIAAALLHAVEAVQAPQQDNVTVVVIRRN